MWKLLLLVMVASVAVGSCGSPPLRSRTDGSSSSQSGGRSGGGDGGSDANTGGIGGHSGTGGTAGAVDTGGTGACPAGESLCSVCGYPMCAAACPTTSCAGGTGGSGGLAGSGGMVGSGGATGGASGDASPDVGLDARVDGRMDAPPADAWLAIDAGANSCENPWPLQCGDRLNHSTLVQGRANLWSTYGCSQRSMQGPETIYLIQPPEACQVSVTLKASAADLDALLLSKCDFKSCTHLVSTSSFTAGPTEPRFLVVDGYDGAAGSYTLEVDCACNQDAGTVDAPPPDLGSDTAVALGCDPAVAAQTLSALGLISVGDPQMLTTTLPAALATDANWGLKASVCQQAGYDITALAGKTVCLLGQDITQMCQGDPSTAWVVMNDGAAACLYKTARQGFGSAPGVYAANDPSCAPPAIAPGASVACEGRVCNDATGPCCPATSSMNRVGMCWSSCSVVVTCDGPEDCSNGAVCCSLESAAGLAGAFCVQPAECVAPSRVICHQPTDCPTSQNCGVPNPMPLAASPYAGSETWRVSYLVCAP